MFHSLRKQRGHIGSALLTALLSMWLSVALLPCAVAGEIAQACPEPMPCCPSDHDPAPDPSCAVMQAAEFQDQEGPTVADRGAVLPSVSMTAYLRLSGAPILVSLATPSIPGPDPTQQHRVLLI